MSVHSQGPFSAGLGSDVPGGDVAWNNPNNITTLTFADVTIDPIAFQTTSNFLVGSSYPFAIPLLATIVGILVEIFELNSVIPSIIDHRVGVVKAGVPTGSTFSGSVWPAPPGAYRSYGGASNLFGTTWTPVEVNNALFGAYVQAENLDPNNIRVAQVKDIRITVFFQMPADSALIVNMVRG
jgi:hypothetical protein